MMPEILFVCTANQIRSPLAEEIFKHLLKEHGHEAGWRVKSAGTWATADAPPIGNAVTVGRELGIDISKHRSQSVDAEMINSSNLILVMEQGHKEALQFEFPEMRQKIFLITEVAGDGVDIADPVGKSLENYRLIGRQLQNILTSSYDEIVKLAAPHS
jgi:protein-tyrosine phosphatase